MDVMIRLACDADVAALADLRRGSAFERFPEREEEGVRGAFCLLVRARGVAPPELAGRDGRHGGGHDEPRPVRADAAARAWPGPVGLPRERVRPAGVP